MAAVATVALGTAPPASGASAAPLEPSAADATHTWVMEQTANDLANASPIDPQLVAAVKAMPVKALAPAATIPPLQREVFGFAFGNASLGDPVYGYPSWSMNLLSTIAYFGLTVNWDGNLVTSGSGWTTWNSPALTGMVAAAHANHVKVILSLNLHVFSGSPTSTMCSALHPTHRAVTVAATVAQIAKMHVDGVNLDYEGTNTKCAYQAGTTAYGPDLRFEMSALAKEMRAVDTYSGSAADTLGFFDVKAMAPYVTSFFVMTYDMEYYNWAHAPLNCTKFCLGPTSPLTTYYYNDTHVMAQYVSAVGASKTILGVPYYGRKECVAGVTPTTTVPNAYPVSGSVASDGYLDASQENGYYQNSNYHAGRDTHDIAGAVRRDTWHSKLLKCTRQMYFDDAYSIGKKYDLVNQDNLRGAGIFALQYGAGAPELWDAIGAHFTHPFAFPSVTATQTSTQYTVNAGAYYAGTISSFALYSFDVTAGKQWFTERVGAPATSAGIGAWTSAITVHGFPGHTYEYKTRAWSLNGLVSPYSTGVTTTVAPTATSPLAFKGMYALRSDGYLRPLQSPPVATWQYWSGPYAQAAHPLPGATAPAVGAVMSSLGYLVPYGEALTLRASVHWTTAMARDFAFLPNGTGGYVLDRHGRLWPFAVGKNAMPPAVHGNAIWPTMDRARKVVILPGGTGGYVLDATGGVNPFAIGRTATVPAKPVVSKRWTSYFAFDMVLVPGTASGYVLNGYGGMYPFTAPGETKPVVPAGAPYWSGHDIARGFFMLPGSTAAAPGGYILDCAGGLNPWGNAPAVGYSGIWSCGQAKAVTGA